MFDDHPPSDQDLTQWQNFDQLLSQYQQIKRHRLRIRQWWLGAILLIGLSSVGVWYYLNDAQPLEVPARISMLPPQPPVYQNPLEDKAISSRIKPVTLPPEREAATVLPQPAQSKEPSHEPDTNEASSQFEEAQPVQGYPALYEYFATQVEYPEAARADRVEGSVLIEFFINEQGEPDKIRILQGVREDIDQEAIRLIRTMPVWTPARVNGTPVATKHTMPLTFQLDNEQ